MKKVIIVGPAHPLRGGLASFNQRLALEFNNLGYDCAIWSYSLQYPTFLFPGTTQYSSDPAPQGINIQTRINSISPLNWLRVGNELKRLCPDIIVVRFWLPFMGPALGTILRIVGRNKQTRVVAITDNVIPHEKRPGDTLFTRYFLKSCDAFITMSEKVLRDLLSFETGKPYKQVLHPMYDNFGPPEPKESARKFLNITGGPKLILFFGFIRKYKGLDILLRAMQILKNDQAGSDIRLIVAGEFYEDRTEYDRLIEESGIGNQLILRTEFIRDSDVRYYLSAADVVVQPYRNATQSGVTPLSYHFEKPMIVTNVGSLPDLVPHMQAGLVCEPEPRSIADAILRFYELGESFFIPHLRELKKQYSWKKMVDAIEDVSEMGRSKKPARIGVSRGG